MSHCRNGFPQCPGCSMPLLLCLCGQAAEIIAQMEEDANTLAELGSRLWAELFQSVSTIHDLEAWEKRVPNYDCTCQSFYLHWKSKNQPAEVNGEIPFEWKWSLKSAVNRKLGHADLTLEEARQFWSSVSSAR
ncbi:hypothetical protein VN12_19505 [Pirellula sp. SH-Sr6A]|nr:hypothetical protein VN12_19505 [Pirellula sp. SH-Sr6A]